MTDKMTDEQKLELMGMVDNEGFDYAFCDYSSFSEYKDKEFHTLRKKYIKAAEALKDYINYHDF